MSKQLKNGESAICQIDPFLKIHFDHIYSILSTNCFQWNLNRKHSLEKVKVKKYIIQISPKTFYYDNLFIYLFFAKKWIMSLFFPVNMTKHPTLFLFFIFLFCKRTHIHTSTMHAGLKGEVGKMNFINYYYEHFQQKKCICI